MRKLRIEFDKTLTKVITELAERQGLSRAQVVHAAVSLYKQASEVDETALSTESVRVTPSVPQKRRVVIVDGEALPVAQVTPSARPPETGEEI